VSAVGVVRFDDPWRRLPAVLAAALLLSVGGLVGLAQLFLAGEAPPPMISIDATMIEAPAAAAPAATAPAVVAPEPEPPAPAVAPEPPPPVAEPEPILEPPPVLEAPPVPLAPALEEPPPVPTRKPRLPAPPAPEKPRAAEPPPQTAVVPQPPAAAPAPQSAAVPRAPAADALAGGRVAARAIFQPMPQIPDELRRGRLSAVAVVVFHVAPDGSATVELKQATDDMRLNRVLLEGFSKWRFFPAMEGNRPVASSIELRVPVQVQ
jgi:protein TonB